MDKKIQSFQFIFTRQQYIKIHTLYDIETQIPTLFHITSAKVNDVNAMDVIPCEIGSYYVFD